MRNDNHHSRKDVRMTTRKVGISVVIMASVLVFVGGKAYAEDPAPLPEVPAEYADKKMPAGFLTDPKVLAEGVDRKSVV